MAASRNVSPTIAADRWLSQVRGVALQFWLSDKSLRLAQWRRDAVCVCVCVWLDKGSRQKEVKTRWRTRMTAWRLGRFWRSPKHCRMALSGTAGGGSCVQAVLSYLPFVFPHMDVISPNLPGFVKWQPDRATEELCFVGRTWHSGTRCLRLRGMHWQTLWQLQNLCCVLLSATL